jgi:hypothetical protein
MAQRYLFLKIEFGAVYVDFRGVPNVRYVTVYKINIYADLSGCRTGPYFGGLLQTVFPRNPHSAFDAWSADLHTSHSSLYYLSLFVLLRVI